MPKKQPPKKPVTGQQSDLIGSIVEGMVKTFGKGAAFTPTKDTILCKVDHWATSGNFVIDAAIRGNNKNIPGGVPFGRLTEVAGLTGSGKTSLLGHFMASTQKMGGIAAVSDTEESLDLAYWEAIGVNLQKLILVPCKTVEDVFTRLEELILRVKSFEQSVPIMIGWDSLGATPTKAMKEAKADKHFYAEVAKVVGKNLQRTISLISEENIALIFANHLYRDINVQFGDPWKSYGGEKVQFLSSLRVRMVKGQAIKIGGTDEDDFKDIIGHQHIIKVIKNKMAPILKIVRAPCMGGLGFYEPYVVYDQAVKQKIITKSSSWNKIKLGSEELNFQGWNGFQEKIVNHPEYKNLREQVKQNYFNG